MDKETFKSLLSILCIISGIFSGVFTFYYFPSQEDSLLVGLMFSFILIIIGMTALTLSSKRKEIIYRLKSGEQLAISRWLYRPNEYSRVKQHLHEHFVIQLSMVFLFAILGMLLLTGALLSSNWLTPLLGSGLIASLVIVSLTAYFLVETSYKQHLNRFHECIISYDYFYFESQLHGLQKGFYNLDEVKVVLDDTYYLQFIYTTPGTPYGPFEVITIPIPSDYLDDAYKIQAHYLTLINDTKE